MSGGGASAVKLLNSVIDAAEVPALLFLLLEADLAGVAADFGYLLLALEEDLAGVEGISAACSLAIASACRIRIASSCCLSRMRAVSVSLRSCSVT